MSITVKGKVEHKLLGLGAWALVAEDGKTYELKDPPSELQKNNVKVQVTGKVRDDVMTIAMIGPVLEVTSFKVFD